MPASQSIAAENSEREQEFDAGLEFYLKDIDALEVVIADWEENQLGTVRAYRKSIEDLHKEAFRRLIVSLKSDPGALTLLKDALQDEVVYAVLRHLEIVKPSLQERVEEAIAGVRPMLESHGGDVELVEIKAPDTVRVRFLGACDGCPASMLTFIAGVKKAIEEACPEITDIQQVKGLGSGSGKGVQFVSPFAIGQKGDWQYVTMLDEIPEGDILTMQINGEDVILSRNGSVVSCFQNSCAHLGMPMDMGTVSDGILTCPHHGFQYDLKSGECLTAPEVQLQPHAVRVITNKVEVRLAR